MADELRGILGRLALYYYDLGCKQMHCVVSHPEIIQTVSEIKSLIKSKLPKKKPRSQFKQMSGRMFGKVGILTQDIQNMGYNNCLTEIEKIMEEL